MSKFISVADKSVVITGAAGIIGSTLVKAFLEDGAKVLAVDIERDRMDLIFKTQKELFNESRFRIARVDITNANDCTAVMAEAVAAYGRIDVLINNAAIDAKFDSTQDVEFGTRFENYDLDKLRNSLNVNITGTITITQAAAKAMLKTRSGSIINLASTYSLVAPNQALYDFGGDHRSYKPVDYVASKSFIPNFSRYIATFYAKDNIRCNTIVPHAIDNAHDAAFKANFQRLSPLGRMSRREELIGAFILLASDASSYMTGSTVVVDGGWTAW